MKTILVPCEDHQRTPGMLRLAHGFAVHFQASVDAVALRLPRYQAVGAEPIVAVAIPPLAEDERESLAKARTLFDDVTRDFPDAAARLRWRGGDAVDDQELGALARVYDCTVIARPDQPGDGARMTTLEAVLFESGRPILLAPPNRFDGPIAKHVVMSWNQSTEGARTLAAAMPILAAAETVTILTIEGATVPGPSGAQVKDYLAAHGISANHVNEAPRERLSPGAAILERTKLLGGDLLIKSAYTQSRLRQMIFGGATSHILGHADIPVLMAN